jgi:hypothetical protein
VKKVFLLSILSATTALTLTVTCTQAQITLIAKGTLTSSRAGECKDFSGLNYKLENGVAADLLGGLGSGITYMTGIAFLAVPDRGPNAVPYNPAKIEGITFGPDVELNGEKLRTLWIASSPGHERPENHLARHQPQPVLRLRFHRRRSR